MQKEICVPDKMCFWSTATRSGIQKQHGQGRTRHPRADCRSLGERGGMMSDDVILRRLPYPASQCFYSDSVLS
ncbi:hypothetical protein, partial [Klebsiella pneumoniae]|uniref:hypothetical protein n=1 Tax=Klebsiella pneumoniae TaxID=573 RepID=UPI003526970E